MKLAITADVHLRSKDVTPEPYHALGDILRQCDAMGIRALIIAGDLFDKDYVHSAGLESFCGEHPSVTVHVIPGNHDASLSPRMLAADNVIVHNVPTVVDFDGWPFLFLPYRRNTTMADEIGAVFKQIEGRDWVLVAHGDYTGGPRERNPHEPGTYMPLSRGCLDRYGPLTVFLGHIHKPSEHHIVWIPGSPCPLDVSETGRRRFLVYDTASGSVASRTVNADVLYFWESFLLLPDEHEVVRLQEEIADRVGGWTLEPHEKPKVRVRIEASGYAMDRSAILETLRRGFERFQQAKRSDGEGPIVDQLYHSSDPQLLTIAKRVREEVDHLQWEFGSACVVGAGGGGDEPTPHQVILEALKTIYQV